MGAAALGIVVDVETGGEVVAAEVGMQVNIRLVEALFMDLLAEDYADIAELQRNRLSGNGEDDAVVSLSLSESFHASATEKRREAKNCKINM